MPRIVLSSSSMPQGPRLTECNPTICAVLQSVCGNVECVNTRPLLKQQLTYKVAESCGILSDVGLPPCLPPSSPSLSLLRLSASLP